MGPDIIVILLIVLLPFGAKKLPEPARGMGRAAKEFSASHDEVERELGWSGPTAVAPSKLLHMKASYVRHLEQANSKCNLSDRRSALMSVGVGGGFAGVHAPAGAAKHGN
jgi:sec-independent protein translocase protein TatA